MEAYQGLKLSFIMENYQVQKDAKVRIFRADEKIIDPLRRVASVLLLKFYWQSRSPEW